MRKRATPPDSIFDVTAPPAPAPVEPIALEEPVALAPTEPEPLTATEEAPTQATAQPVIAEVQQPPPAPAPRVKRPFRVLCERYRVRPTEAAALRVVMLVPSDGLVDPDDFVRIRNEWLAAPAGR